MRYRNFIKDVKLLYYVAKIVGLAPFALRIDPVTKEGVIEIRCTSSIGGLTASVVIFVVLLIGFVFATFLPQFSLINDPVDAVNYAVSVPLNFVGSLVLVTMGSTVNRHKFEKLVNKLASIDKNLYLLSCGYLYERGEKNGQIFMLVLVPAVLLLLCDVIISVNRFNPVFCIVERSCQVITLVAVIQYCRMALMIRGILSAMQGFLSSTFCKRLSTTNSDIFKSGAVNATGKVRIQTCNVLQASRCDMLEDSEAFGGLKADVKMVHLTDVQMILKLRRIYYRIYECVKVINFMYGLPILIHIFRSTTGLITLLYGLGKCLNEHMDIYVAVSCTIWTTVLLGTIVCVTIICDMAACKTKDVRHKLQALLLKDNVSREVVGQLKLFRQQMSNDRIAFTAAGMFDVDLSLLCTVLTSVTTYLVVLIQFKLH